MMPPLISEEESNALDSGDESDDEPMSTEMLEDSSPESNAFDSSSLISGGII